MSKRIITIITIFSMALAGGCGMLNGYSSYIGPEKSVDNSGEDVAQEETSGADTGSDSTAIADDGSIWVSPAGDDSNLGTISSPYLTIGKAVATATEASGSKEIHITAGDYKETVTIGRDSFYYGIRILGGYGSLDASSRDTAANITKLNRLVIDGSAGEPMNGSDSFVEGMTLSALSIKNASPLISGNIISQSEADGTCRTGAALVIESSSSNIAEPVLSQNKIINTDCSYDGANAIYIAVEARALDESVLSPRFENNEISSGVSAAVTADTAISFMAHAAKTSKMEPTLNNNLIEAGSSMFYASAVNIWADSFDSTANLYMTSNDVKTGQALLSNSVDLGYDGIHDMPAFFNFADIERNKIASGDESDLPNALSIYNSFEISSVVNNFISAGKSQVPGAWLSGIYIDGADADIINNTVFAESPEFVTLVNLIFTNGATNIVNNIFSAAGAGIYLAGIAEAMWGSEPASVVSNLFDSSLTTVYSSANFGDLFTVAELAQFYPWFDPNYMGDALLVDPANMDLHIGAGSAAVDMADQVFAPASDFDGTSRPLGASSDIGADELM